MNEVDTNIRHLDLLLDIFRLVVTIKSVNEFIFRNEIHIHISDIPNETTHNPKLMKT